MAGELPPLIVEVQMKTAKLQSDIKQVQNKFKDLGDTMEKQSKRAKGLGDNFAGMAKKALGVIGVTASFSALANALEAAGKAAAADAKSQALLAIAMENSIGASKQQIAATEESIGKFSSLYGVFDDKIRPAMAQFVRVTGDATKATKLTDLALNVAAGTGRDLSAVTIALSKAYQGNTGALARLGINVKGLKDPMGELEQKFKGSAEAAAKVDPYQRIAVAMDNAQEAIGKALLPAMNKLADFMNSDAFANGVAKIADDFADFTYGLVLVGEDVDNFVIDLNKSLNKVGLDVDFEAWNDTVWRIWAPFAIIRGLQEKGGAALDEMRSFFPGRARTGGYTRLRAGDKEEENKYDGPKGKTKAEQQAEVRKAITDANSQLQRAQARYNESVLDSQNRYNEAVQEAAADYAATAKDLAQQRNDEMGKLNADNAKTIANIQKDFSDRLASIVQQSMNRLRDAFKGATQINIGDIFKTAGNSLDSLLTAMKDKLGKAKELSKNAALLAGAGFSQTFIEQVVAQGGDAGNQMAQSILAATPEAQKQLQDLFVESENTSNYGMDALAKSMYEKSGLATNELRSLYTQTQSDLVVALADQQASYEASIVEIQAAFDKGMADAAARRDEAMAAAQKDLTTALAAAAKSLSDSLIDVEKTFNDKIRSMQGKFGGLGAAITKARKAISGAQAAVPATSAAAGAIVTGGATAPSAASQPVVINSSVTANTNASPDQIQQASINGIKYNLPYVLAVV